MESGFGRLAIEAIFPRFCLSCKSEGQIFCSACQQSWKVRPETATCPFCGEQGSNQTCVNCQKENYLDGLSYYLPYGNPMVRKLIGQWKYDSDRSVEEVFQTWFLQSIDRMHPPFKNWVFSSVPVHVTRKRSRGFDQGEVLARIGSDLYLMPHRTLLIRTKKTVSQAKQSHDTRKVGVLDGIFSIHPGVNELPECVVLCDDVFTSGATMDAAVKCLKEAGVKYVWGFVLAKG